MNIEPDMPLIVFAIAFVPTGLVSIFVASDSKPALLKPLAPL